MYHGRIQVHTEISLNWVLYFLSRIFSSVLWCLRAWSPFSSAHWLDTYSFIKLNAYRNLIILRIFFLLKNLLLNTVWDHKLLDKEGQILSDWACLGSLGNQTTDDSPESKETSKVVCMFCFKTKQKSVYLFAETRSVPAALP